MQPLTALLLVALGAASLAFGHRLLGALKAANLTDWGSPWLNLLDGANRWFCLRFHRMTPVVLSLPSQGPAIVVANHVSGLDPLLLIAASPRPLRFIIAREQFERLGFNWLFRAAGCLPVDRSARPDIAFRAALRALRQGEVVALFPHGAIHLPTDPPRKLKPGAVRLALLARCPIVPVLIRGIAAEGRVIAAVFVRSRAALRVSKPLSASLGEADLLAQLDARLSAEPG